MKSRFKISAATVKQLTAPGVYWDAGLPGFGIRVRDPQRAGGLVYVQRYYCRRHQKDHWVTIGRHGLPWKPDPLTGGPRNLTADLARLEAGRVLGQVADGRCPAEDVERARRVSAAGGDTFGELARRIIERADIADSTRRNWLWVLGKRIVGRLSPPFGERSPATITRRDVGELLEGVKRPNEVLNIVRWVYGRAIEQGILENDPTVRMGKPEKEVKRDRVLQLAEIRAVWLTATRPERTRYELAVQLAMLTGARRGEIFKAKRSERDREAKVWRIPSTRSKNRRPHDVPLSDLGMSVWDELERAGETAPAYKDGWLIPGDGGHLRPLSRNWEWLLYRAGVLEAPPARKDGRKKEGPRTQRRHPFTFHDLRRTVRDTLTRELGVSQAVAEAVIGHASPAIVATYAPSGMLKECRKALERWERKLLAIAAAKPEGNVVEGAFGGRPA